MARVITATNLRARIREVIQSAQFRGDHIIVTVFNKPAVAIIGIDEYRDYLAYKDHQQQRQDEERRERLRALVENDSTPDESTEEKLQAIIEGRRAASRGNREKASADEKG